MAYRRSAAKRRTVSNDGSFWLSFSDLMSSLVLIIVLVLFYIIYQYFNLAEINQAEIARRQLALDETQTALESRESELALAQAELETQQSKLTEAEKQMISQQILLDAKEAELSSAQDILTAQRTQLSEAQSALSDKEAQIAEAQNQLDALSAQLSAKQTEIDDQEAELASAKAQLATQQTQLSAQQAQIADAQLALTDKEAQIAEAQLTLSDKEAQINDAQNQLQTQQTRLEAQQIQLEDQQSQLETQRTQLENQQSQLQTQQSLLENQQAQIEALVGMKTRIISSLSEAFRDSRIQATVDPLNGSIALESDVLFESAKYTLTQRGQKSVDQVLPVYLDVLFSDEYRPYVAEVIIEGHTDSDGTWMNNLALSQQRALAVASYALGDKCRALSPDMKNTLKQMVTVNGRSWSDRVFNANGTENKDASRRVVFKFRLTDEEMIRQLQTILEDK